MNSISIPPDWYSWLDLLSHEKGTTILLGATDTGKSTLARFFIHHLCQRDIRTAFVDADIGQSVFGPPTTIGLRVFGSPSHGDSSPKPGLFFVGATSPEENIPLHLQGVKRMADKAARSRAEVILVDTTGLVYGDLGKDLKRRKIDLLSPRFIFALQRTGELEPILEVYRGHPSMTIYSLSPSEQIRPRSRDQRKAYRTKRFEEYFLTSAFTELAVDQIQLGGKVVTSGQISILPQWALWIKRLLIGLKDSNKDTLALGIIDHYRQAGNILRVWTPLRRPEKVRQIQLSSLRLLSTFEEERI
jgi:polynucleotide 5'-hydroxyl-kinase GRC3/NOL9